MAFGRWAPIEHGLAPHYPALRAFRDRRALHASALWRQIGPEVQRTLCSVERGDMARSLASAPAPTGSAPARDQATPDRLRVAAWNIQRGARFPALLDALRGERLLAGADVLMLVEVDCGLGRSGNRNVPRDLALALGMSYAFAPSYLTIEDDWGENPDGIANTSALAGTALLSRWPIRAAENLDLPELRDKFSSSERRLGKKRALAVEIEGPGGPWRLATCHLDSNASPAGRARQLRAVLEGLERIGSGAAATTPALVGGDLNASTHDLSSGLAIGRDVLRILAGGGLSRTIDDYMRPEATREHVVFDELARHGFIVDGLNDRAAPTYHYDFADPYAQQKLRRIGGAPLVWLVRRLLRRWQSRPPARLDWMAGRGIIPLAAHVVTPSGSDGRPVSDHGAVVCDVRSA
ncbi:MAG TPA: endonuclease/exonuclease/phosphatase family protein [Polyangia bacterium]